MSDNDDAAWADDPPGAVATHGGLYGSDWRASRSETANQATFASPNSAFPYGYRRLGSVRGEELRPELLEPPCAPAGIALSFRDQPGYDHVYYVV